MKLLVGCDVCAPLYGKEGCVLTYSAQKGANAMQMNKLEQQLHLLEQRSARNLMQEAAVQVAAVLQGCTYSVRN